ncbi:MAG: Carbamoyl-phosphate synthase large chain [Candidatus Hinthialibacteria bacterium OLB16]|nr:MAG: Carbamoyl-phosphate synthase large chain [Candidatus Hinthialibacteria bacterium OLB16]
MEHIEQAGIHSGDSACVLPPRSLPERVIEEIRESTRKIALTLGVRGLMNVQFAVQHCSGESDGLVYVLEVNPRASRTVPFVSKATGTPLARIAALVMVGKTLEELALTAEPVSKYYSVKEAVLPFVKFRDVDPLLGPEMRSTGEVMGISDNYAVSYAKAQAAAGNALPAPPREGEIAGPSSPSITATNPPWCRSPRSWTGSDFRLSPQKAHAEIWPNMAFKPNRCSRSMREGRILWTASRARKSTW